MNYFYSINPFAAMPVHSNEQDTIKIPTTQVYGVLGVLAIACATFYISTVNGFASTNSKIDNNTTRIINLETDKREILNKLEQVDQNINTLRIELKDKANRKP